MSRPTKSLTLPVLPADDPCRGCGACCLHVGWPPFLRRVQGFDGEPAWNRLVRERPDLVDEILLVSQAAVDASGFGPYGPCVWFDAETRRCRHYELRGKICRDFEPGSEDCLSVRKEYKVDEELPRSGALD
jgi:Fe-S-cluster containining protein